MNDCAYIDDLADDVVKGSKTVKEALQGTKRVYKAISCIIDRELLEERLYPLVEICQHLFGFIPHQEFCRIYERIGTRMSDL